MPLPEDIYKGAPNRIPTPELLESLAAARLEHNATPEILTAAMANMPTPPLEHFSKKPKIANSKEPYRTPTPHPKKDKASEATEPPSTALQVTPDLRPQAPQTIDPSKRLTNLSL